MKKFIFFMILVSGAFVLHAQSLEQGIRDLYNERYQSAENEFHQVLKQDPDNAVAWLKLSRAYLLQDELDKANDSIELAPASIKSDPFYKVAYGTILLRQNQKEGAAIYFDQALEKTRQKDPEILAAIAKSHIRAKGGDVNYAIELLNKAIKRDKHNAALYVQLGDAYRKIANSNEAYKAYEKAIEENDKYAIAYHRLGEIFLTQKNADLYVDYFKKAIAADPDYSPSYYKLYLYEFYRDPAKAMEYYKNYASKSDPSLQNEYDMTDLLYLNKQYQQAIQKANSLVTSEGTRVQPRLYKLIGYSYAAEKDTAQAITYMQQYFAKEADSNFISKDYVSMGDFYSSAAGQDSLAAVYLAKGVAIEKDAASLYGYYKRLAEIAKERKDYVAYAGWLAKYYAGNDKATNLDLFNWGLASYRAENYAMADSVFGMYVTKYPEQSFGYYWQAKSKALQDTAMKEGLAVPAYKKLVDVLQKDTTDANYKKWTVEAYGYLAAYEVNTQKDYAEAISYFEKILGLDPDNESAKKYIPILEKNIKDNVVSND